MENKPGKSEHKFGRTKHATSEARLELFFYCGSLEEEPGDELLEALK